mmetsp:Transcript_25884/g.55027  ORF Transcript_25884/g.55027 Transcript_25884/m.55027 type:complete len:90 (+) Transcript_25884:211-480(+)
MTNLASEQAATSNERTEQEGSNKNLYVALASFDRTEFEANKAERTTATTNLDQHKNDSKPTYTAAKRASSMEEGLLFEPSSTKYHCIRR